MNLFNILCIFIDLPRVMNEASSSQELYLNEQDIQSDPTDVIVLPTCDNEEKINFLGIK